MTTKSINKLADLTPDPKNANRGTERGRYMVDTSLEKFGAGRSIVVDRDGVVIAGNKTLEAAYEKGLGVRVVETDGQDLVVVQRTDLSIDDERGRGLAYADNRSSEVGLDWDVEQIAADQLEGIDLMDLWRDSEIDALLESTNPKWQSGTDPASARDGKKVYVRPVLQVEDIATVEQALLKTGLPNRADAFLSICKAYLGEDTFFNLDFTDEEG